MKVYILTSILVLFFYQQIQAQAEIVGMWKNEDTGSIIKLYEEDNLYYGKIVKVEDNNNKEKAGHLILSDLNYVAKSNSFKGQVRTANGFTASCELHIIDLNRFRLTASKMFFKKNTLFTRVKM